MAGPIKQHKKIKIWIKDKLSCVYCARTSSNKVDLTVDHVLPKAKGGTNDYSNLVTACKGCNSDKADMLLPDFISKFNIKLTKRIAEFL